MKRYPTEYPGVIYRQAARIGGRGTERVYYVRWKKDGIVHEEKVGRQYADDMTAARAARIRGQLIEGDRITRPEQREIKRAVVEKWTIEKIWEDYLEAHSAGKSKQADRCRWEKYIKPDFGDKEPAALVPLDVQRLRIRLTKTLKPQSVKNTLELLRRLINHAAKNQLCQVPPWKIEMPVVNSLKTEDLTKKQIDKLLDICREGIITDQAGGKTLLSHDARTAAMLALVTGMRRGELSKLRWMDIDFQRGFITIREPKGGTDQVIPMSSAAREVLQAHPQGESPYVFPGRSHGHRHADSISKECRRIRDAADLPKDFRPLHGLRHTFASHLASSGAVDLYTIQRLLTHKSPAMTQRYAHLRDEALRKGAELAGGLLRPSADEETKNAESQTAG